MNRPYSEATRDKIAETLHRRYCMAGKGDECHGPTRQQVGDAEAILDDLAGLLLPEGAETRTEWGVRLVWDDGRPDDIFPAADHADAVGRFRTHRHMRAQGGWLVTPHIVRREALSYASPWTPVDAVGLAVGDSKPTQDHAKESRG